MPPSPPLLLLLLLLPLSTAQLFCPIGSIQPPSSEVCICPSQKFLRDDFVCLCHPGTKPLRLHTCQPCSRKARVSLSDPLCTYCRPGEASTSTGCFPCRPGFFQGNETHLDECTPCPDARVSPPGAARCERSCPKGTFRKGRRICLLCPKGSFGATRGGKCKRCRPGTFAAEGGAVRCAKCRRGSQANGFGSIICVECDERSVAPRRGTALCTMCKEGMVADEERRKCVRDPSLGADPSPGGMGVA